MVKSSDWSVTFTRCFHHICAHIFETLHQTIKILWTESDLGNITKISMGIHFQLSFIFSELWPFVVRIGALQFWRSVQRLCHILLKFSSSIDELLCPGPLIISWGIKEAIGTLLAKKTTQGYGSRMATFSWKL